MPDVPAWRLDDLAAYDSLREAAGIVATAQLEDGKVELAAATLRSVLSVDPFARADVDALAQQLSSSVAVR